MKTRIAIIGYGAVASIHARKLAVVPGVTLAAIVGPKREKASAFAAAHNVPGFTESLAEVLQQVDAAILCSPSSLHFEHARECLQLGLHTLVELPPCQGPEEAERLARLAQERTVTLMCAHTSRYLAPYRQIKQCMKAEMFGRIQQVVYIRHPVLRERSWTDDALLHHAAHPLDLMIDWFEEITPVGCVAVPTVQNAQSVSLLGRLPRGAPVSISISYASKSSLSRLLIVGDRHTVETDGFSYVHSTWENLQFTWDPQTVYEQAILDQDMEFIRACKSERNEDDWQETSKLVRVVKRFQELGGLEV